MTARCANCGEREETLTAVAVPSEVQNETVDILLCNDCLESDAPDHDESIEDHGSSRHELQYASGEWRR